MANDDGNVTFWETGHLDDTLPPSVTLEKQAPPKSAGARRVARHRQRKANRAATLVWERADWRLFLNPRTLPQKAGCQPGDVGRATAKELTDNACDNGAGVTVEAISNGYIIRDRGPGIDPKAVPRLFAVNRDLVSSKLPRTPLRGMLGNGLRVVMGAVAASDGTIIVETRGHRLSLSVDPDTGKTIVTEDKEIPRAPGTNVHIMFGSAIPLRGTELATARKIIAVAGTGKPSVKTSSPYWYGANDIYDLCRFVSQPSATVGDIAANLGFELDDPRLAQSITKHDAGAILERLRAAVAEPSPDCLGCLGPEAFPTPGYARKDGKVSAGGIRIPYVIEAWAECTRVTERNKGTATVELYINRTVCLAHVHGDSDSVGIGIYGCGLQSCIAAQTAHYRIKVSLIAPLVDLANDGKTPALEQYKAAVADAVEKAARQAHRAMERPERGMKLNAAAWKVMVAAYMQASDNGKLPCPARMVMYAARPEMIRLTGKTDFKDAYFTQVLLPDYVNAHPVECKDWRIDFDARGHFKEPHTLNSFGLGTAEVRGYLGDRPEELRPAVSMTIGSIFPTHGPANRFDNILYIEKEGFDALIREAKIAERFDIAVMSCKGMSVVAARRLLDRLATQIKGKIFVAHDCDYPGFSIFGTLGTDGRRYTFENKINNMVDIGLRLDDVERLNLPSEPWKGKDEEWPARAITLRRHGATEREIEFLKTRRVELNAMTARQFVDFLDAKLTEHGVKKVMPDADAMKEHARRLYQQHLAKQVIEQAREDLERQATEMDLPPDLKEQVEAELEREPSLSWDEAEAAVVERLMAATEPPPEPAG
jgi:DNA topoisomerase 6 subunit A-like protein